MQREHTKNTHNEIKQSLNQFIWANYSLWTLFLVHVFLTSIEKAGGEKNVSTMKVKATRNKSWWEVEKSRRKYGESRKTKILSFPGGRKSTNSNTA